MRDFIDRLFTGLSKESDVPRPLIACLYTGIEPSHCGPMTRAPTPAIGMPLDESFASAFLQAIQVNLAIHDGAVMFGRTHTQGMYKVAGWSYRLYPGVVENAPPNQGSAFNSCLAMSAQQDVDRLYLVRTNEVFRFVASEARLLLGG